LLSLAVSISFTLSPCTSAPFTFSENNRLPLKLSVGLCRKQGLPDYGSIGASCHLEVELPADLLSGAGAPLQRQAEIAFDACRDAVNRELARYTDSQLSAPGCRNGARLMGRHDPAPVNGVAAKHGGPRRATSSQVRAIEAIARRQNRELVELLQQRYGLENTAELSITEASELIDSLKAIAPTKGAPR
jgi:hypothetical protein